MATVPIRSTTPQQVSHAVITAAMTVHNELGLGLLESTYTACLQYEPKRAGFLSASRPKSFRTLDSVVNPLDCL